MRKLKVRCFRFVVLMVIAIIMILLTLQTENTSRMEFEAPEDDNIEPHIIEDAQEVENISQPAAPPPDLDPSLMVKQICFEPNTSVPLDGLSDEDRLLLQAIPHQTPTFYMSETYQLMVCAVPKAGSTFWTRAMAHLTGVYKKDEMRPIFNLSRQDVHKKYDPMMKKEYEQLRNNFNGSKIITTRNPYARLYSTYIDKIYLPSNLQLFTEIRLALTSNNDNFCGKNISFTDFLNYITKGLNRYKNSHWEPISSLCSPCDQHKVEVVKTENFVNDVEVKLTQLGVEGDVVNELLQYLSLENHAAMMASIHAMVVKGFEFAVRYCFSRIGVLNRIWRALQIQGAVKVSSVFPFEDFLDNDTESRLKKQFQLLVLNELQHNTLEYSKRNDQQRNAVVNAYRQVPPTIVTKIQELYGHDFVLFDYGMDPPQ